MSPETATAQKPLDRLFVLRVDGRSFHPCSFLFNPIDRLGAAVFHPGSFFFNLIEGFATLGFELSTFYFKSSLSGESLAKVYSPSVSTYMKLWYRTAHRRGGSFFFLEKKHLRHSRKRSYH